MGHLHRVPPNKSTTQGIKFDTNSKGQMLDANTKEVLELGKMDRGHKFGYEERVMQHCAEKCHMSQKDYGDMMQDPRLYQWENSHNNRSGKFECKDFSVQVHNCMEVIRSYYRQQRSRSTPKFKATEFSPKLKSIDRDIAGQKHGSVKAATGTKAISGARTSYGGFSAAKGSLSAPGRSGIGQSRGGAGHSGTGHGNGGHGGSGGRGGSGHGGGGHGGK